LGISFAVLVESFRKNCEITVRLQDSPKLNRIPQKHEKLIFIVQKMILREYPLDEE
jgi:hypothetical protein